jgi:hypothetical protein
MTKKITGLLCVLLLTVAIFLATSCKKESAAPNGGVSSTSGNTNSTGDPSGTYSGFFISELDASTVSTNTLVTQCGFYSAPLPFQYSLGNVSIPTATVSSVYCNGIKFKLDQPNVTYGDTTGKLSLPPALWMVNGTSSVPGFTYTCNTPFATYTGTSLPATINRTQNLVISLSSASGYDQAQVEVYGSSTLGYQSRFVSSSAGSITFSKDSLATIQPTTSGNITITLMKYNPQVLGGKNYLFATMWSYTKSNVAIQ